jgi:DNA-directed RNA polymerase subunit RPC12/RpoP
MPDQPHKPPGSPNGTRGQFDHKPRKSTAVTVGGPIYEYQELVDALAYDDLDEQMDNVALHNEGDHGHESTDYYCPTCAEEYDDGALGEYSEMRSYEAVECHDCGLVLTASLGFSDEPSWRLIAMSADGELQNPSAWQDALQYYSDKLTPEFKKFMSERSAEFREMAKKYR